MSHVLDLKLNQSNPLGLMTPLVSQKLTPLPVYPLYHLAKLQRLLSYYPEPIEKPSNLRIFLVLR